MLGLLLNLKDNYQIKSNRESGFGRYDIMIIPRNREKSGIIIEFKKISSNKEEALEKAAAEALEQIERKKYEQELLRIGVKRIIKVAIVFSGKKVKIREA
ncbi:PD-(D/E)XK nuclease superfamily protein [Halanaerobium saccharolyticum]|uniref:PD-(D/E)XK nuclease superfamily protein n=1 Tax=Halanaerobium saccharolyticum TaxID=43595 RepID=A0A4R6LRX8_9FIRM|nr:PD-(D/E)XK nuclease domain-containing protein [Halanaerobium saccharolyticum]TDO91342.1 PD-(D/E)XK nuclease superfamily protein [Halanaerobium saccharolyticum]